MATVHAYPNSVNERTRKSLSPAPKPRTVKPPTKQEIESYLSLRERASELEREARTIRENASMLGDKIEKYVRSETRGKRRVTVRCGYELALEAGSVRPSWKQEFIAELGEEAAQAVVKRTPPSQVLRVEPLELKVKR